MDEPITVQPILLKYAAYSMLNNCLNHSNQCPHKENRKCPIHKLSDCGSANVNDWILFLADQAYLLMETEETQEN